MTNTPANDQLLESSAEQLNLIEQLKRVELFNGRAAMLGIVIGIVVEGLTGLASPTRSVSVPWWMATPPAAPSSCPSASEPLLGSRTHHPRLSRGLFA
jgi:hypothetical protein